MFKHFLLRECAIKRAWRPLPQTILEDAAWRKESDHIKKNYISKSHSEASHLPFDTSFASQPPSLSTTAQLQSVPKGQKPPWKPFIRACPLGLLPSYSSEVVLRKISVGSPWVYWLRICILIIPKRFLYTKLWDITLDFQGQTSLCHRSKEQSPSVTRCGFCLRTYCSLL